MALTHERFEKVFERHEFAIDSSNSKFKAAENMKKLLEEERKRRKEDTEALDELEAPRKEKTRKAEKEEKSGDTTEELRKLIESAK